MAEPDFEEILLNHLDQMARLFEQGPGLDRAVLAHHYANALSRMSTEARALRNVELLRARAAGVGPAALGRALELTKARGDQLFGEAGRDDEAQAIVNRLRRQILARRKK